jgi:GNAT superfamily N-acetyltransferase
MVQRYITGTGYDLTREDMPGGATYTLTKQAQGVAEGKVKLYTDPGYFGAEVDDTGFDSLLVVNIPTNQLVGFEPDSKMNQPKSRANVEKIVAGLKKGDKLPPLLVRKYKKGYQVLDGHHRFWAYKLSGTKSIPVRIVADKDIEEISKQDMAEDAENFNGIDISIEVQGDEVMVRATASGRELGHVLFVEEGEYLMPQDLEVEERFQGQGIAAAMYDYVKSKGYRIRRSGQQTDAGAGFWGKHRPEQNVWENFADGRNPGRKGLAKRSGVNTKASVSSLRKTAKNSSGEKARMAHWLANMKAGRAKAKKK